MLVQRQRKGQARIVLISLVDVIFLLLLFFLLTTKFSDIEQIELNATTEKSASKASGTSNAMKLIVRLGRDSAYVNEEAVPYAALGSAVKPYLPAHAVVIKSSDNASLQQMVQAIDAVKMAGGSEITLEGLE